MDYMSIPHLFYFKSRNLLGEGVKERRTGNERKKIGLLFFNSHSRYFYVFLNNTFNNKYIQNNQIL